MKIKIHSGKKCELGQEIMIVKNSAAHYKMFTSFVKVFYIFWAKNKDKAYLPYLYHVGSRQQYIRNTIKVIVNAKSTFNEVTNSCREVIESFNASSAFSTIPKKVFTGEVHQDQQ